LQDHRLEQGNKPDQDENDQQCARPDHGVFEHNSVPFLLNRRFELLAFDPQAIDFFEFPDSRRGCLRFRVLDFSRLKTGLLKPEWIQMRPVTADNRAEWGKRF
jgi:hypothetical protein